MKQQTGDPCAILLARLASALLPNLSAPKFYQTRPVLLLGA